jgi:protein gp37
VAESDIDEIGPWSEVKLDIVREYAQAGTTQYKNGFLLTLHPEALEIPVSWKKPKVIFVNSMSDSHLSSKSLP